MKLKKQNPEKTKRKSDIAYMALVATMVNNIVSEPGVCGIQPFIDSRRSTPIEQHFAPGVLLQPWKFMEIFGEATNFEYIDHHGYLTMITEVNGVVFHTLVDKTDLIRNGRLI